MGDIVRDNIHYSAVHINSYYPAKCWLITICEREAGKSTVLWLDDVLSNFRKRDQTAIILRNRAADISEAYLDDIQTQINLFKGNDVKITYKKGSIKDGVVDVNIEDNVTGKKGKLCRVIAIGNPVGRIKSLAIPNPSGIYYDECILRTSMGERYVPDTWFRIKEIYNTFQRYCIRNDGSHYVLKFHAYGNPYSRYFPIADGLHINPQEMKPGAFIIGKDYVCECYKICEELKQEILKRNPLYSDKDSDYYKYAFMGESIDDEHIPLQEQQPEGFQLRYVFRVGDRLLQAYRNSPKGNQLLDDISDKTDWWVTIAPKGWNTSRTTWVVNFNDMVNNTRKVQPGDKCCFIQIKDAFARRKITFHDITSYYLLESLYPEL